MEYNLQKHKNMLDYALQSVFTYKVRTTATVTSLTLAIMVLGSVAFLSDGLKKEAETSVDFAPDITVQFLEAGRQQSIPQDILDGIIEETDITVAPRNWGYVAHQTGIYTVMGIDVEKMPISQGINLIIESGRFLKENDGPSVIIGTYTAQNLGVKINDSISLTNYKYRTYNYTVVGIFSADVRIYTADLILMPIQEAGTFFDIKENMSTDLCVYLSNSDQTRFIAEKIASLPNLRVLTRSVLRDALITAYGARSGFISIIWYILLITVIMVAWNQASTVSNESRREVGLLKSFGFNTLDILEIRLLEAAFLGFISASLGITLAIIYDIYLNAPIISDFILAWASIYPQFKLPIYIESSTVVFLYLVGVFPLIAGSVIPAWLSAITEPDLAIRGV